MIGRHVLGDVMRIHWHPKRLFWVSMAGLALIGGCARDRAEVTPTTLGTDLTGLPRGRMTAQPFPGTDLVRERGAADGAVQMAGSSDAIRR